METEHGHYGEYKVLVDGDTVVDGGMRAALGIFPPGRKIVAAVRERLASTPRHTTSTQ